MSNGIQQGPPPKGPANATKVEVIVHSSDEMDFDSVEETVRHTLTQAFGDSVTLKRNSTKKVGGKGVISFAIQINSTGVDKLMLQTVLEDAGLSGYKQVISGYKLDLGVWPVHDEELVNEVL
jgi:hypothetical protein